MKTNQGIPTSSSIVPIHLLLVEDNPGDARLVFEMLRDQPHIKMEIADCLAACIISLDQGGIDLVLLDLGLRDSQGLDTLTTVAQAHPALPIVALTGLDDDALALRAVQAGGQDYLTKNTVSPEILRRTIRHAIERKRAEDALRQSKEMFSRVFQTSPYAITITHAVDGRFVEVNDAFTSIAGYTREEALADSSIGLKIWVNEEERQRVVDDLRAGKAVAGHEYLFRTKSGKEITGLFSAQIIRLSQGTCILSSISDITERKRAETGLRDQELKYRTLFETADDALLLFTDEHWIDCNSAALKVFGCTREQIIGAHPGKFSPPTQPDGLSSNEEAIKKIKLAYTEGPQFFEWTHCRMDGTTFPAEISLNRLDLDGKPHMQAIVRDITARKRAEEMLRENRAKLQLTFDDAPICIATVGMDKRFLNCNRAFCDFVGYSEDELKQKTIVDITLPEDADIGMADLKAIAMGAKKTSVVQKRYVRKDGTVVWGEVHINLIRNREGKPMHFLPVIQDITERKRAEEALAESEKKLRTLFETMSEGIVYEDHDGKIIAANPAAERLLGLSLDQMQGRTSLDPRWQAIHEDGSPFPGESHSLNVAAKTGKPAKDEVMGIYNPQSGSYVWLSVNSTPEFLPGEKEPFRAYAVFRDISERKQAEETIRQSEARLRAILDATPFPIAIVDVPDSKIDFWSRSALSLFGHTAPTTAEWYELAYPDPDYRCDVVGRWKPLLEKARASKQPVNTGEYRVTCRDGSVRICELHAAFLADNLIVTFNDISERKQAEAAIALNSQRVQTLLKLNQMHDASLKEITDFALEEAVRLTRSTIGYLAFLNEDESVLTMHSWSRSAMAECAIIDKPIVYPVATTGLWGEAVRQRRAVITNDYTAANPLKKGCPEGHVAVKRHMNTPVFAGSRIVLVAGVGNKTDGYDQDDVQQLTLLMEGMWRLIARRQSEDALRESERKFRETIINLDEGYYSVTLDGKLLEHNQAFNRILGFAIHEDLKGIQLPDFWQDPEQRKEYLKAFAANGAISNYLINAKTQQGEKITVLASAHLVKDENDRPQRIEGVFLDISARKQAEATLLQQTRELRARNEELEQFNLGMVGRELRMIELKEEINELCRRLGEPLRHDVDPQMNDGVPGAGPASAPPDGGGA